MMVRKILVIALLGYCVMGLWGCAGMVKKEKPMGSPGLLEPQAILKFADVPIPMGFKLLSEGSYTFESGGVRVGVLKYQGRVNVEQVVNFYKEQMPMYNWNLLNIVEYGERLLNFDRDTETCIIRLLPKRNSITMTITLGPKSQISKKSKEPIK